MTRRIAIIEPVGGHSGMDYYDFGLCQGVDHAEVDVSLYTCDELGILAAAPFPVFPLFERIYGEDAAWRRGIRYLRGSWRSLTQARRRGAEICHFHYFHIGVLEFVNVLLTKLLGMKLLVTAHDVTALADGTSIALFTHWTYRLADHIIAHNEASRRELVASLDVPIERVAIIRHGNYLDRMAALPATDVARRELGIPAGAKTLLFFGQIKSSKGLDDLLKALPLILETEPKAYLIIAGRLWKEQWETYQRLIDRHHLHDHVHLTIKHIPHTDVGTYFAAADLVVLPYQKIYQSGVLLLTMGYGRPVLASDLPGMKELIEEGETGYLFKQQSPAALAEKAVHILDNLAIAHAVGAKGANHIAKAYDWRNIGKQTAQLYDAMCNPALNE